MTQLPWPQGLKKRRQKYRFQFESEVECKKELLNLSANKPPGLSELLAVSLKNECKQ